MKKMKLDLVKWEILSEVFTDKETKKDVQVFFLSVLYKDTQLKFFKERIINEFSFIVDNKEFTGEEFYKEFISSKYRDVYKETEADFFANICE